MSLRWELVTAKQKQDQLSAAPPEVDPVARTEIQAGFPHTTADLLVIAEIAQLEP
jgi:hypothetical protein